VSRGERGEGRGREAGGREGGREEGRKGGRRKEEGGRRKGGREEGRKEEGGRRKEEGGRIGAKVVVAEVKGRGANEEQGVSEWKGCAGSRQGVGDGRAVVWLA